VAETVTKVDQQETRQESVVNQLSLLALRVDSFASAEAQARASVGDTNIYIDTKEALRETDLKAHAFSSGRPAPEVEEAAPEVEEAAPADDSADVVRLIRRYEELAETIGIGPRFERSFGAFDPKGIGDNQRQRFIDLFRDEIQTVRTIRNNVAHGRHVPLEQIHDGNEIIDSLLSTWSRGRRQGP
jgi:hypothetical protein